MCSKECLNTCTIDGIIIIPAIISPEVDLTDTIILPNDIYDEFSMFCNEDMLFLNLMFCSNSRIDISLKPLFTNFIDFPIRSSTSIPESLKHNGEQPSFNPNNNGSEIQQECRLIVYAKKYKQCKGITPSKDTALIPYWIFDNFCLNKREQIRTTKKGKQHSKLKDSILICLSLFDDYDLKFTKTLVIESNDSKYFYLEEKDKSSIYDKITSDIFQCYHYVCIDRILYFKFHDVVYEFKVADVEATDENLSKWAKTPGRFLK